MVGCFGALLQRIRILIVRSAKMDDLIAAFGGTLQTTTPSSTPRDMANHEERCASTRTSFQRKLSQLDAVLRLNQTSRAAYPIASLHQESSCANDSGIWQDDLEDEEWAAWTNGDDLDFLADDIPVHSPALEAGNSTFKPEEAAMVPHRQVRLSEYGPKKSLSVLGVSQTCSTDQPNLCSNPWQQHASAPDQDRPDEVIHTASPINYDEIAPWQDYSPTVAVFPDYSNGGDCEEALMSNPWHTENGNDDEEGYSVLSDSDLGGSTIDGANDYLNCDVGVSAVPKDPTRSDGRDMSAYSNQE
ncbi:hypothetical protein LTR37_013791 [Vermiconidia calcicola]|uniref:Uncharacterized protein n=1 Tax=Vermiconidia calcicola TaxID=1690605 RepID=A0ACC3MWK9_9PEZI|nr:hypothetical protein LTR37_013791 [Vermiconidia calcicola]